jgi:hypothetical protein
MPLTGTDRSRRLQYLTSELQSIGVHRTLNSRFLDEILYAMYPPVHERKVPLFGAMTRVPYGPEIYRVRGRTITALQLSLPFSLAPRLIPLWSPTDTKAARESCDGQSAFLLIEPSEPPVVARLSDRADELYLSTLQREEGISTAQRTGDGKVKLYLPEFLATHDRNVWTAKPYSNEMAWPLAQLGNGRVAQAVLDLAVHVLSPAGIGATFVWVLSGQPYKRAIFDEASAGRVEPLATAERQHFPLIRSLAAQNDRAIVLDHSGAVVATGVGLKWSAPWEGIQADGGTRHNSAAKSSHSDPEVTIVVVSADGPVSVFFRGRRIASFLIGARVYDCDACEGTGKVQAVETAVEAGKGRHSNAEACRECDGTGNVWIEGPIGGSPWWQAQRRRRATRPSRPRYDVRQARLFL